MVETMTEYRGVGLAAPQVHEELRIFVALLDADEDDDDDRRAAGGRQSRDRRRRARRWSRGGKDASASRTSAAACRERARLRVRALNRKGERIELPLQDFPARVVQHETDHLDGVLFFDRMRSFESLTFLDEYARFWAKD